MAVENSPLSDSFKLAFSELRAIRDKVDEEDTAVSSKAAIDYLDAAHRLSRHATKIRSVDVQCSHCGTLFSSPITFTDGGVFDTATLTGNKVQCPNCREMTDCNKENMRVRYDD